MHMNIQILHDSAESFQVRTNGTTIDIKITVKTNRANQIMQTYCKVGFTFDVQ